VKPAPFDHVAAGSVAEAVQALGSDEDARVLAGGQSLVPVMALRLATPTLLVDISRCPDLQGHALDGGELTVGAAVTDRALERDPAVVAAHPLLARALGLVAHPEIRARGTLCGSLAHADPAAELPALLLATGGAVEVTGPAGARTVPAEEFFAGPFTTTLGEGEMVVAARLPLPRPGAGWAIEEVARRHGDFALAGAVCGVELEDDGRCRSVRVVLFGLTATPALAGGVEEVLAGEPIGDAVLDAAAAAALDGVAVLGDAVHGSEEYRRTVGRAVVRRALASAGAARGRAA
jgi:carbon-monoxide dehydrogenase medium subunit